MNEGIKMTRQRHAILDVLRATTKHPTADEVFQTVRKAMPRISLGTVYRNLDLMAESGVILRLPAGKDGRRHYDGNSKPHLHVRCVGCGRMDDIEEEETFNWEKLTSATGYCLTGCSIELTGYCPDCATNN
jgi:Fe2+ or Zn2+ uptake regulation protein